MSTSLAPQPQSQQQQNPNAGMSLSASGRADLIRRESVVPHYYNDGAHNCTYGVGALLHYGPCTAEELRRPVTEEQIVTTMDQGIHAAERAIRHTVNRQPLTQAQFDALASFTYNLGATGASYVLHQVNSGQFDTVRIQMQQYITATVRGPDGRPLRDSHGRPIRRIEPGLVIRRHEESAPFRVQDQPRQP